MSDATASASLELPSTVDNPLLSGPEYGTQQILRFASVPNVCAPSVRSSASCGEVTAQPVKRRQTDKVSWTSFGAAMVMGA